MQLLEYIIHNPYFPFITFVIGILVSTFFYFKSKKNKDLRYILKTYNLIKDHSSKFSNLSIKYNGADVKNFTVTKVIFWNNGKETIDGKEITVKEPLKLKIRENHRILDANVIQSNNPASQVTISEIKDDYLTIQFDYLDYLNGAGINIIHDGEASDIIEFIGKIKGLRRIKQVSIPNAPKAVHYYIPIPIHHDISNKSPNKRRFYYGLSYIISGICFSLIMSVIEILENYFPNSKIFSSKESDLPLLLLLLPGFLFLLNGIFILSKRIPEGLDVYEDL